MDQIYFTVPEVLSLIGIVQCVYVLVHLSFKGWGSLRHLLAPLLYFFVLGIAFFVDFARSSISELTLYYDIISWAAWAMGPPLSVLVIIQMSQITKFPSLMKWCVTLFVPLAFILSYFVSVYTVEECGSSLQCPEMMEWLNITGLIAGAASLLVIWSGRNIFTDIQKQKAGRERYWLILSLLIVNVFFLALIVYGTSGYDTSHNVSMLRTVLGLAFIYLVSTSLFRIYPSALSQAQGRGKGDVLDEGEVLLIKKIDDLLALDKIYHEATYSRSDLAQELGVPEATISRVINLHYSKSFPQLLNELRIEDAKHLLLDTDENIKIVAEEVGFNSLPSFNRVFKDIVGQSPSLYRKNTIK
ncbi:MAG: helix-turn-helix domain-containing protein [Alphaproteobacteria bacterium]